MHFCSEPVLKTAVVLTLTSALAMAENKPASQPVPRAVSVVRTDARTGRLVRSVVVQAAAAAKDDGLEIRNLVEETSKNLEVNPMLVDSVIQVESNYNRYAVSPKGAQGL